LKQPAGVEIDLPGGEGADVRARKKTASIQPRRRVLIIPIPLRSI
jgi:hypothetical protein